MRSAVSALMVMLENGPTMMFSPELLDTRRRSVLCWLATADAHGEPNVSPKEIFACVLPDQLLIAHIASPVSVRNVRANPQVCVSFIDVFTQKGYKLKGLARVIDKADAEFASIAAPLVAMAGERFPIHAVIAVQVKTASEIVAPSYRLYPDATTEASQKASAMQTYGVRPAGN